MTDHAAQRPTECLNPFDWYTVMLQTGSVECGECEYCTAATDGTGTALIFARTETSGFVNTVWNGATAILFLAGRLRFHRPDGSLTDREGGGSNSSGAPSCLVAYGEHDAEGLRHCGLPGAFVTNWSTR